MVEGDNVSLQKKIDYFFEVCGPNINAWDPSGIRINCTSSWCGSVDKGAESERRLAVFNEVIKEFGVGRDDSNPFLFVRLFRALIPMTFSTPCIEVHWLRIKRVDCRWDYAYWKGLLPLRFFGGGEGSGDGAGYGGKECRDVGNRELWVVVVATVPSGALILRGGSRLRQIQDHPSVFVVN